MKKTYRAALLVTATALFSSSLPLFATEMDDRIESSAKQSYVFRTYLKDDDIKVDSQDGVAILTGTVSDQSHKALASETVAGLPGVTGVENKLTEKTEGPAVNSDAWLVNKVQSTLLFHSNVNAIETEVSAKEGVVTLRGDAANKAQKDLATEYAKDVEGVKSVQNEMTVPVATMKPGEKTMAQKMDAVGAKIETMGEKMGVVVEKIDDASITALVKTTLGYHRSTSALSTSVKTKDGVVKLGGKARNAAEKDLATKFATDVPGVKMVVNDMVVEGIEPKTN